VSSVSIGFHSTTYSEVSKEPSISTIGGDAVDSMAASIAGGIVDLVATSIGGGAVTDSVVESIGGGGLIPWSTRRIGGGGARIIRSGRRPTPCQQRGSISVAHGVISPTAMAFGAQAG
jgi:hypothetical protein